MKKFWYVIMFLCFWGLVTEADESRPMSLSEEKQYTIPEIVNGYNSRNTFPQSDDPWIIWETLTDTDTEIIFTYRLLGSKEKIEQADFETAATLDKRIRTCIVFGMDVADLEMIRHRYYDIDYNFVFEITFTEYDCMLF